MTTPSVFIGVPAYGGMLTSTFVLALFRLLFALKAKGINFEISILSNESLITRARNNIANEFLTTTFTHLLFIDADQGFNPEDIITALGADKDIIGLPCAKKGINWERVQLAAKAGVTAEKLSALGTHPAVVFDGRPNATAPTQPLEVLDVGTGIMLINRRVFEWLAKLHPEWRYNIPATKSAPASTAFDFFQVGRDPETGIYHSEDYFLCSQWRKHGGRVWILPSAKTIHVGKFNYEFDLESVQGAEVQITKYQERMDALNAKFEAMKRSA